MHAFCAYSSVKVLFLDKGAPPTPPQLLFPPKALIASSSNQIPATVQWRGTISDNTIAACLNGCTYVCTLVRETIQSCIKFFRLYLSCYLWLYSIMCFKLDNVATMMLRIRVHVYSCSDVTQIQDPLQVDTCAYCIEAPIMLCGM